MVLSRSLLLIAALAVLASPAVAAPAFEPGLDLTAEVVVGRDLRKPRVPANAPEATTYPLPELSERELLTELPGRPLRQVDPPPQARAWWKYPFYVVLGLPRDLIDATAGTMAHIPVLNLVVLAGYEVVPLQLLARDPRDWHAWPGRRNRNGHGMIDSEGWGWFPSANQWRMSYPSQRLARRNERYNEKLREELRALNDEIEEHNQALARERFEARRAAIEAIRAKRPEDPTGAAAGREATLRMIPYYMNQRLDEGAFALLIGSLALYADAPGWADELLWHELVTAQPAMLNPARQLLAEVRELYPQSAKVARALILADVLMDDPAPALAVAQEYPDAAPGRPARNRLVFETALAAGEPARAREALDEMRAQGQSIGEQPLMQARLAIAEGELEQARRELARLLREAPGDPYANYFIGAAELAAAQLGEDFPESARLALERLERAELLATGTPLRRRVVPALAYMRAVVAGLEQNPVYSPTAQ